MTFWQLVGVLEVGWVAALSVGIVLDRRSPVATLAWIGILAWLPLVGALVYYFFGPRRLRRRKLKRQESAKLIAKTMSALDEELDDTRWSGLARLAVAAGESPPLPAAGIELFFEGDPLYAAIVKAIDAAEHHVHVEYYIFDGDRIGELVRDALVRARKRRVEVRLLLDGIGAYALTDAFVAPLVAEGGEVAWFNPVSGFRPRLANFRTHRKIVLCDGAVAFTGGMNVTRDHSARENGPRAWRDTHVTFRGPAARALQRVFLEDWTFATGRAPTLGEAYFPTMSAQPSDAFPTRVQVVASGPDRDLSAIHQFFFGAITQAQQRVWLSTPYFVPDEPMLAALVATALRGVDVRILVPARSDNVIVDLAARSYFPELVRAGVRLFAYEGRMLHAKTLVIDGELAVVGTANFDNRSFRLNFEVVAAVYDPACTDELARAFTRDLEHAPPIQPRELRRRDLLPRLGESSARLFSPLL